MALSSDEIRKQAQQAEELLEQPLERGFAKSLFFGQFVAPLVFPYPQVKPQERDTLAKAVADVRKFVEEKIDAFAIDRNADIPRDVIDGLAELGVLGMTAPEEYGGRGFSQLAYTRIMEIIGGHCASTAVFVNAHHSIGIRALILFGTEEQKRRWLPDLVSGKKLAAFALTEPEAGSDAANVQTMAVPTSDGKTYVLNGEKRYITNGSIAGVLTVMARTPVPGSSETKVSAFLVTPDMPGFEVLEARMDKCGIRGTVTSRLAFRDMPVPAENLLGQPGKGLKIALTVLDFGRTTFGASCTGAAKTCIRLAVEHAKTRKQFGQPLAEFELVKKKIAYMAAHAFAMEAVTTQCASFIDSGAEDYMLETAMLKVFSTEHLWTIVNEALQIYGGKGYFTDQPLERMMRDARINQIGEGANEVLLAFIAAVGLRELGQSLKGVLDALQHPLKDFSKLWQFGRRQLAARLASPEVPVRSVFIRNEASSLAKRVRDFGLAVQNTLIHFRKLAKSDATGGNSASEEDRIMRQVFQRQYMEERLAWAAIDLYASACALARLDHLLTEGEGDAAERHRLEQAGRYFLRIADRRIQSQLRSLWHNDDEWTTAAADAYLA